MNYKGRNAHDFWLGVYGVPSVQLRVVRMLPRVLRACGTAVPKVTGRTLQKPGWRSGCGCSAAAIVVCQASNNKLCVHFFVQCSRGSKFWFCFEGLPINLLAIWKSFADPDPGPIWICFQKVLLAVFRSQSGRSLSMSHLSPRMNALWITLDNLWNIIRSFLKWGSPKSSTGGYYQWEKHGKPMEFGGTHILGFLGNPWVYPWVNTPEVGSGQRSPSRDWARGGRLGFCWTPNPRPTQLWIHPAYAPFEEQYQQAKVQREVEKRSYLYPLVMSK